MTKVTLPEYRTGRNFIRLGDTVKIRPTRPGKRDGFEAVVREIVADPAGSAVPKEVTVIDKAKNHWRTVRPERVQRVAQSRVEHR